MQGQRSTVDSLPETFEFEHGSNSSNTGVNQQLFWNNMLSPVESRLPEYILSPGETSIMGGNAVNHESRSLSGWSLGDPSSSGDARNQMRDETKTEHGWSSSLSAPAGVGPRLEERQYEPSTFPSMENVNVSLDRNEAANGTFFSYNSSSDGIAQNINLNAGYVGSSSNGDQAMEADVSPSTSKSGGSYTEQLPSGSGSSDPLGTAVASSGYILEESDGRPGCSLDGRRLSCKRKALEGASGQSSLGGGPSWFQRAESSAWHAVPAHNNGASSSSIPTPDNSVSINPTEQLNPRFGVGMRVAPEGHPALSVAGSGENSQRSFRVRVNRAQPQDSVPPNPLSTGSAIRRSHVWSSHQASRLLPFNQSSESRSSSSAQDNANPLQSQSHAMHIPGLARNVHPFPWNGSPNSRVGSSSSSAVSAGERSAALREAANQRNMTRTISEHPIFGPATEMRNLAQDPSNWTLPSGNINILGHTSSTSRIGSGSGVHPSPAPTWIPHQNPPSLYPQRLSEFARRSLFPPVGSESGSQTSTFPALRSGPSGSSQEMVLPSGVSLQGHHQPHPRSAFWTERQGDGVPGVPFSLRTLAAAGEGRSRLVSEIRNVLDLMRRGESLRFEDVLILDQSVFYGGADLQDRHRDMRLDVDNMSYEELLALEERIGNVSTGLNEETILKYLKQRRYLSITIGVPAEVEPCCICQEEYVDGEDMGTLDCGHDFHSGCIKQWLMHKNMCPICKTTALVT
ncbi:probable E3 ubiquitin-protein ligase RHG1A [Macadamia integrifolia]|uniref:probable E3 ubiquitin-protein ligase RHG1A n=1 Tax=Macadamia integrifolia TaxID=60698 RepID=UPI001C4F3751|nr:probable E3 ubiquitin-protein ligase RHG1A [Macadamia integrifolia]XP_042498220.1 probable E3 ubiquitin-protein ligase RHG1A [Macadamia integrifolia]XP_042498221.1 probable E3 ubiquitin-protein ligase RHG1A [Macadamia integrifolia]XP_042498222.1 probable E3 ubiquitin-protein ligase RHG1A [Macadamia integrifolia]XP_042498223.1 probable E3 ubiquitin-protein ligase RHG1A [Macadamia integrifolia]